jgi:hypothetical protein
MTDLCRQTHNSQIIKKKALGQAVSRRLLTTIVHVGFLVDKLALELLSL